LRRRPPNRASLFASYLAPLAADQFWGALFGFADSAAAPRVGPSAARLHTRTPLRTGDTWPLRGEGNNNLGRVKSWPENGDRMRKIIVKTERLRIVPLSIEELRLLHDGEPDDGMKQAYGEMMDAVRRSPGREEWGTYWNICLTSGTRVGGLCFKGAPDAEGGVEIGYGIDEAYRRNGYASEAVTGVIKWAAEQSGVRRVTAQTEEENAASEKVLLKSGFAKDGRGDEGPLYKIILVKPQ